MIRANVRSILVPAPATALLLLVAAVSLSCGRAASNLAAADGGPVARSLQQSCEDDGSWMTKNEYRDDAGVMARRDCDWVADDPARLCQALGGPANMTMAKEACRETCDYDGCADKSGKSGKSGKAGKDCESQLYQGVLGGGYLQEDNGQWFKEPRRYIQYDARDGMVWLVGETWHGTDLDESSWACGLTYSQVWYEEDGKGLVEFVMNNSKKSRRNQMKRAKKKGYVQGQWYKDYNCVTAILRPNKNMKVWANKEAPLVNGTTDTTRPNTDDYRQLTGFRDTIWWLAYCPGRDLDDDGYHYYYYDEYWSGMTHFGVDRAGIDALNGGETPPGDGTEERDNGVRVDISFRTHLGLSYEDKCKMKKQFSHLIIDRKDKFDVDTEAFVHDPTDGCVDC